MKQEEDHETKMKEKEIERLIKIKEIEKDLYNKGFKNICGIDEAGRGPLAGPVVVAGVIMPVLLLLQELLCLKTL